MKIVVIGLGSMGKRRIRLMKQYDSSIEIIGVDSNAERASVVAEEYGICVYPSIDEALDTGNVDGAFVSTSPLSHCAIIDRLIDRNTNVFTEINLVEDGYERFIKSENVKLFLSSTFLYRRDIDWISQKVKDEKVNYIYHTGQYLPDWHPWENYKSFFVGDKRTNGCREIMAIEFPWIISCFGTVKSCTVIKDKMSGLQIDYNDNYMLQIEHENGNKGMIAVDVVARKAIRRLEVYNENLHIFWGGSPTTLQEFDIETGEIKDISTYDSIEKDNRYCDNIIENAYMDEIDAFFTWLKGDDSKVHHSFAKDLSILKIINEIEE